MDKFKEIQNLLKLTKEEIDNLNRSILHKEIEPVLKAEDWMAL